MIGQICVLKWSPWHGPTWRQGNSQESCCTGQVRGNKPWPRACCCADEGWSYRVTSTARAPRTNKQVVESGLTHSLGACTMAVPEGNWVSTRETGHEGSGVNLGKREWMLTLQSPETIFLHTPISQSGVQRKGSDRHHLKSNMQSSELHGVPGGCWIGTREHQKQVNSRPFVSNFSSLVSSDICFIPEDPRGLEVPPALFLWEPTISHQNLTKYIIPKVTPKASTHFSAVNESPPNVFLCLLLVKFYTHHSPPHLSWKRGSAKICLQILTQKTLT